MILHKSNGDGYVTLLGRGVSEDGSTTGDFRIDIEPDQVVAGLDYDAWRAMPNGPVRLDFEDGVAVAATSIRRPGSGS